MGKALRQAPYAKACRPPRTHSPPLLPLSILWIDPVGLDFVEAVLQGGQKQCPPRSNSSSRSAASISLAASIAKSSSPSSLRVSKTPGKNSVPPAAAILTPSLSSKPKPRFILPDERDLIPAWICISPPLVLTATKAPLNALASVPNPGAPQTSSVPPVNHLAFGLRHKGRPQSTTFAPPVIPPS